MKRDNRIDNVEAYRLSVDLLKRAGFGLSHVSRITETSYYRHPARDPFLMRVSMHRSKRSPIGMNNVVARLTFTAKDTTHLNADLVESRVKWAIGEYFLGDPRPSRWQGKRGTWEPRLAEA